MGRGAVTDRDTEAYDGTALLLVRELELHGF
jgi:hypothetical protein